jgi:hypothetical protein
MSSCAVEFFQSIWAGIGACESQIVALSALAAAIIALIGLRTWRKELKGKSEYQIAKETLRAVYRVRDGFQHVRNPVIFSNEYPEEMKDARAHLDAEKEKEGTSYVYQNRFKILNKAFCELEERVLDAQVEWGGDFTVSMVPLRSCRAKLLIAIRNHVSMKDPNCSRKFDEAKLDDVDTKLYDADLESGPNPFTVEINAAVAEFEKQLRPHIKG